MTTLSMPRCGWLLALVVAIATSLSATAQTVTINGTLGSGSPDHAFTTGTQTGRLFRDGIPSTCAVPKATCPGVFTTTGARAYDSYTFENCSPDPVCVEITLTTPCTGAQFLFGAAYLNSFNPSSLCENYLADGGSSPNPTIVFSFTLPAGDAAVIVISEVAPGSSTGCTYSLVATGLVPGGPSESSSQTAVLTPPNGTLRNVVFDFSCGSPTLTSVTSSDPEAGTFASDQPDDIQGESATSVNLRAEATPGTDGRIYTLTFSDGSSFRVLVPLQTGAYALGGTNMCGLVLDGVQQTVTGPAATIPFVLGSAANVTASVYSMRGKEIARLATNQSFAAGSNSVSWNGTTTLGRAPGSAVPDGAYVVVFKACGYTAAVPIFVDRP